MLIEKTARATVTAVEMDIGDVLRFRLTDGQVRSITLIDIAASVHRTTLKKIREAERGAETVIGFRMIFLIDGKRCEFARIIGSEKSFYEPPEVFGLRIWPDACTDIFKFLNEDHGPCKPRKRIRIAIQDARSGIAQVLLHPWCPLPKKGIRISDCYDGHDCWMGPYWGASAHGGLDINHPAGTPLWTPFAIDEQYLYERIEQGANNNSWKGSKQWEDGSKWILRSAHIIQLTCEEGISLPAGFLYARSAGVNVGSHEHTHFSFAIIEPGESEEIQLDPWILFRQMFIDHASTVIETTSRRENRY